ncbi:uncharacterized protein OCT59_014543 [Rhizophagus irregularis]|uniref:uncharacterized protein n=1 Tax=Rhizophagus irregularis TaxID=588596 RepID=UPI0033345DEA|nr:hypothetical protein OCT59_014543 [Rhizophagus irregularis]
MMWLDERINKSVKLPVFSICCAKGKVILPFLQELPLPLNTLLTGTDPRLCTFRQNIRIIGSLSPNSETQPQFAQIYIYDTDHEIQNKLNIMPGLDPMILGELQQMLHDINPYVNQFRQAGNLLKHNPSLDLKLVITNNRTKDPQRYNTPNASEVAAIMIGNGQEIEHQNRDIVLQPHEGNIKQISELHCAYTPLHYVLMFPRGEDGWHPKIPIYNKNDNISIHGNNNEVLEIYSDNDETDEKYVTAMNYFAYRLQIGHPNEATTLHYFG